MAEEGCLDENTLNELLAGLLTEHQLEQLEDHIDVCAACRVTVSELGRLSVAGDSLAERFEIRRELGAGGGGIVHEAFDPERGARVALKRLRATEPGAVYRFKREFRALADIRHPNLVTLHELFRDGDEWFFTMELVPGGTFIDRVRPGGVLDEAALRRALLELASGLDALHGHLALHGDLKPSNVLVASDGRVVICDFGLVRDLSGANSTVRRAPVAGTLAYMSPEQARGETLTVASDWYSVGIMLFQALTGALPFLDDPRDVEGLLRKKLGEDVGSPALRSPSAPADLALLCEELTRVRVRDRPSPRAIVARLGVRSRERTSHRARAAAPQMALVGRDAELTVVTGAMASARSSGGATVLVRGRSGVGKSALVASAAQRLRAAGEGAGEEVLVLSGRCYARESMPYKAFDAIVDALTSRLVATPDEKVRALLPAGARALTRLFPAFERVRAVSAERDPPSASDPVEQRREGFRILRELFGALARSAPLVVCVDDLQWADVESVDLLAELVRPPDAPPMLLLGTYRSEDEESPLVSALVRVLGADVRCVSLDRLTQGDARTLASSMLAAAGVGNPDGLAERIAEESGGNPFYVGELVRYEASGAHVDGEASAERPALHDGQNRIVRLRVAELGQAERELLTIVAVAGRPTELRIASAAAGLAENRRGVLETLARTSLARTTGMGDSDRVETLHDRVREVVIGDLAPPALRACHGRLADAYERLEVRDAEILAEHWEQAGEPLRAAGHAKAAAEQAARALAFDHAARLFERAIALGRWSPSVARALTVQRGSALANAGRGAEAADVFLAAIAGPPPAPRDESRELRRRAAHELLRTGYFDRALEMIRAELADQGIALARTPTRALVSLVWQRGFVRESVLRAPPRRPRRTPDFAAIDMLWSTATGLSMIDSLRAADLHTRHLRMALAAGEPTRLARALLAESTYSAAFGTRTRRRTDELAERAMAIAVAADNPYGIGLGHVVAGVGAYLRGEWKRARELCEKGTAVLRERCTGVGWERNTGQHFMLCAMFFLGDLAGLASLLPERLRDLEERGDLYAANGLRGWRLNAAWLATGDLREAERQAEREWQLPGFHVQHYYDLASRCQLELFKGEGRAAYDRVNGRWSALRRAKLLRIQNVLIDALYLRGACALAAFSESGEARLLRRATRDARRIVREGAAWGNALAKLLLAACAVAHGETARASALLGAAATELAAADMALFAIVAKKRRAELAGDRAADDAIRAELASRGIRDVERTMALLTPGFPSYQSSATSMK